MHNFFQDIRFALRSMRKSPGFAIVAVITLALGIGANTAIFTVVNAVFFHPIPVRDPERLLEIFTIDQRKDLLANTALFPSSYPNGEDIQRRLQSFSGVTIDSFLFAPVSISIHGVPDQYFAEMVSGNYFDVLGVRAAMGRTFRAEEDAEPGAGPVIVLSHNFWERKFAADPNIIGRNVMLNGQGFTVIGVAPRGFQGASAIGGPDMWVPMSMHDQILSGLVKTFFNERRFLGFRVIGRLKDGVRPEQANAELRNIAKDLERDFPLANKGRSFTTLPLLESVLNPNQRGLFERAGAVMMAIVGIVLLVACFNVANLLLARAAGRKREMSIRVAVGASRGRIVTQLLTEAMVLATAGGALGLGLAILGRNLLWKFRPPGVGATDLDLSLDSHVLLFTMLMALGTGIVFGLAPALQSSRPDLNAELKERSGGELYTGRRFRLRDVLVTVQVAICLVALIGAGLFLISLRNAQTMDPGFSTKNLAMLSFDLGSLNYDAARSKEFQRHALESIQSLPGVKAATLANIVPLFNGGFGRTLFREGEDASNGQNGKVTQMGAVSWDYLQTMGIPLLRGRGFDSSVREDSPRVAIINETAAQRIWPNQDAIGKRFRFFKDTEWTEVIGIARDSKYNTLGENPQPYMYVPLIQNPSPAVTLFFRTAGDPRGTLNAARAQVQQLDRNLPVRNVWPIGEVISQALWAARFEAGLLTLFAMIAMLLCAVGIYGVAGYSVGQRIREFGIRMALGAQPGDVILMVLRQSAAALAAGVLAGLVAAFVLARFIVNLLYGVGAGEPVAFIATALLLIAIGLLASYVPARRAARV
ncbi:MAG: ABC transporter permease, partial [Actinomycetota bacterium]